MKIDIIIAAIALSFYGILSVCSIAGWLVFVGRKINVYFLISSLLFGLGGSIITIPILYDGIIINGIGRVMISSTTGITMAFAPVIICSAIVLQIKKVRSQSKWKKLVGVNKSEFVRFYNNNHK